MAQMNLSMKHRLMDIEPRLVASQGGGDGGRVYWEVRVIRYKLLRIGWINNRVPLTLFSIL